MDAIQLLILDILSTSLPCEQINTSLFLASIGIDAVIPTLAAELPSGSHSLPS